MTTPDCTVTRRERALFQSGGLSRAARDELQRHAASCARCRSELEAMTIAFRTLVEPPAEAGGVRARMVARALADSPDPAPSWTIPWPSLAGALALVAIAFFAVRFSGHKSATEQHWFVESGEITLGAKVMSTGAVIPKESDIEIAVEKSALLQLNISRVKVAAGTRFAIRRQGRELEVQAGRVELEVKHRPKDSPFSVSTAEAIVRVVGTHFTVDRTEGLSPLTAVTVQEGIVEVTDLRSHLVLQLGAGQEATLHPPVTPSDAVASSAPAPPRPPGASPSGEVSPIAEIRARLRGGQIGVARTLIPKARLQAKEHPKDLPELAVVEAEVLLAEKRLRLAVAAYLDVVKRYPQTPQAEASLIAASQLALDHPGLGFKGTTLLHRYLKRYPQGRFSGDARELLKAFEPSAR